MELAKIYVAQGADELVFLDITATIENRQAFAGLVERIAAEINIPFTVGGGINTVEDVSVLIKAGADKVTINSSAVRRPEPLCCPQPQLAHPGSSPPGSWWLSCHRCR